jgi:acyl-CoA thioesterase-1
VNLPPRILRVYQRGFNDKSLYVRYKTRNGQNIFIFVLDLGLGHRLRGHHPNRNVGGFAHRRLRRFEKFGLPGAGGASGKNVEIINAGVSGSTTASGLSRLKWQLKGNPQIVVIALGANDVLRGIDLGQSEKNLAATIILAKKQNLKVLLVGMRAPPNYGRAYDGQLAGMFRRLSEKHSVPLLPFLLEGVGGRPELNQADRIHPNEKGHKILAETVLKSLLPLL